MNVDPYARLAIQLRSVEVFSQCGSYHTRTIIILSDVNASLACLVGEEILLNTRGVGTFQKSKSLPDGQNKQNSVELGGKVRIYAGRLGNNSKSWVPARRVIMYMLCTAAPVKIRRLGTVETRTVTDMLRRSCCESVWVQNMDSNSAERAKRKF